MKQQFFPQRLFMDMKRLIINRLVGLGLLAVGGIGIMQCTYGFRACPFSPILGLMIIPLFHLWRITSSGEHIMYTTRLVKK